MADDTNPFNLPEFRRELSELLDEKLQPITNMVTAHETAIQRARGAMWVFGAIWGVLVALFEWLFHAGGHK